METVQALQQTFLDPMTALWTKVAAFTPNLIAAIAMIVIGYFVAKFVGAIISKLLNKIGLNRLSDTVGTNRALKQAGVDKTASDILGLIVFWLIMLTFILSAADALGLPRVSATIDDFVLYLPKVIAAVIVLMLGLFVAHFVRTSVRSAAEGMNLDYAKPLASTVYGLLVVIVASLAVEQLDIEVTLFNYVVSIVLIAVSAALALSLGLGTRDIAGNIVAGIYARDLFKAGDKVEYGDIEGTIVEVGTTKTTIRSGTSSAITVCNRNLIDATITKTTSSK